MNAKCIYVLTDNEFFYAGISSLLNEQGMSAIKISPDNMGVESYNLIKNKVNIICYLERNSGFDLRLILSLRFINKCIAFTHSLRMLPTSLLSEFFVINEKIKYDNVFSEIVGFINGGKTVKPKKNNLTYVEAFVLKATLRGVNIKETACHMGLTLKSAYAYRKRGMQKIGCRTMADLVYLSVR